MRRSAALGLALLAGLAACRRGPDSPALVKVNGEAITLAQVQQERAFLGPAAPDPADVLEELIDQALILQEGRRLGLSFGSQDQANAEAYALAGTDRGLLEQSLQARGLALEDWRRRLARSARADDVVRRAVRQRVEVTRQEVQDHYWEHLPAYRSPERRVLRQVWCRDRASADKALRELQLGEPFAEVAQRHGQGPEAAAGGLLGPLSPGQLPKALAEAATQLKPGRHSPLVRSPWGWHILQMDAKVPAEAQSLEQASPKAHARLLQEKEQLLYQAWLARLREQADIQRLAPVPTPDGPPEPKKGKP